MRYNKTDQRQKTKNSQWSAVQRLQKHCLKIGDTLTDLSQPRNYDPTFLKLERREEQKIIQINKRNKETYGIPFSIDESPSAIQTTKKLCTRSA